MAENNQKKVVKRSRYISVHKFAAGVALLCFAVILSAGLMAEAGVISIAYRSFVVMLLIAVLSRIVVSILASYEEMDGG